MPPASVQPGATDGLATLIDRWHSHGLGQQLSWRFVRQKRDAVRRIAAEANWREPADMTARDAVFWLTDLMGEGEGASPKTHNNILSILRTFARWLVLMEAIPRNPFLEIPFARAMPGIGPRALEVHELDTLFALPLGPVYAALYGTGMRCGELSKARIAHCELHARPPVIRIPARNAKARKDQVVPLAPRVAAFFAPIIAGRRPSELIFPEWPRGDAMRADFESTGIRDAVSGRIATPHSLRHSFITQLGVVGVGERIRQELARHSDPRLTAKTYTDPRLLPLAEAVAMLPVPRSFPQAGGTGDKCVAETVSAADTPAVQLVSSHDLRSSEPAPRALPTSCTAVQVGGAQEGPGSASADRGSSDSLSCGSNGRNRTRTCCADSSLNTPREGGFDAGPRPENAPGRAPGSGDPGSAGLLRVLIDEEVEAGRRRAALIRLIGGTLALLATASAAAVGSRPHSPPQRQVAPAWPAVR